MASETLAVFYRATGQACIYKRNSTVHVTPPGYTFSECIRAVLQKAPVTTIDATYIFPETMELTERQQFVHELRTLGFKNIVMVSEISVLLTCVLKNMRISFQPGDHVAIALLVRDPITKVVTVVNISILKKQLKTFDNYQTIPDVPDLASVLKWYPKVKTVIYLYMEQSEFLSKNEKAQFGSQLSGQKYYFMNHRELDEAHCEYVWNHYDKKNLQSCMVKSTGLCLRFRFGNFEFPYLINDKITQRVFKMNVKDAPQIEIFAQYNIAAVHIKTYQFKSPANRKVAITVSMDETLFPTFAIQTVESSPCQPHPTTVQLPYVVAEWNNTFEIITFPTSGPPFNKEHTLDIGLADRLRIAWHNDKCGLEVLGKAELIYFKPKDRKVTLRLKMKKNLTPGLEVIKEENGSLITFEFTSDSRLFVNGPDDYKGPEEYPAYASFKDGNLVAGAAALEVFKEHPKAVVFDVPRLLSPDLDAETVNRDWKFSFSRDSKGEMIIALEDAQTNPYVCFALIVKSVLLNVRENYDNPIERIGIKLPDYSVITEEWQNKITEHIGTPFFIFH